EIRITAGALEFGRHTGTGSTPAGASITRGVDLSAVGSGTATLSFSYAESGMDNNETLRVEFAADGSNFSLLQTLDGNSGNGTASLGLAGPFTDQAAIRFVCSCVNANGETVRIDNVNIAYTAPVNDGNDWEAMFTEDGGAVAVSSLSGISHAGTLSSARMV